MKINDFIKHLRQENIRLKVDGNNLSVSGQNGKIDEQLLQRLKARKAEVIEYLQKSQVQNVYQPIPVAQKQDHFPLSYAQQRLWVHNQVLVDHGVYNMLSVIHLKGDLNVDAFRKAFSALLQRHEILKTAIVVKDGAPVQVVKENVAVDLVYNNLTGDVDKEDLVNQLIQESLNMKFDLESAPLLHLELVKLDDSERLMLLNIHHLIADGWSINLIMRDFLHYYESFRREEPLSELPPLGIQYKDYAQWQRSMIRGAYGKKLSEFWKEYLSGELPVLSLPYDHKRPVVRGDQGSNVSVMIEPAVTAQLRHLAQEQGVSLFMLMMAISKVLFFRYSGQRDIIVGTTAGGREHTDLEDLIGLFINAVPIRTLLDPALSFQSFIQQVRASTTAAFDHKAYPFDLMVKDLNLERDPGRHPVFDVMVIMENTEMLQKDFGDLEMTPIPIQKHISKFDLTLAFNEEKSGISLNIEYNNELFEPETAYRMTRHFVMLCNSVIGAPDATLGSLSIIPGSEEKLLKQAFNRTEVAMPEHKSMLKMFEEMAQKQPDAEAVIFEDMTYSYRQINEKANRLAHYLDELDMGEGEFVGLHMERGAALVISMLGVMKSGAAFVPLDASQQPNRLKYMMQDSAMELLIVQTHLMANVSLNNMDLMVIDEADITDDWMQEYEHTNLEVSINPEKAAYVIYTSGSTGNPKGCLISHGNLLNYLNWGNRYFFEGTEAGNFPLFTSISFDFTLTGIFSSLIRGKQLHIFPAAQSVNEILGQVFSPNHAVDVVKLTPSHISLLEEIDATNIEVVIVGGEALKEADVHKLKSIRPDIKVINEYGPTETTIGCVATTIEQDESVLIGVPIDNTRIYILDDQLQMVPIGVSGELCIAGAGVGLGYLNQPELTAKKFVDNPYEPKQRLYRSGDKARWLATGAIEYLGRFDDQVKIRGHRVEPGEIEQQLLHHAEVSAAVVIAKTDEQEKVFLDAYLEAEIELDVANLRNFLSEHLPEYMIPAHFIRVDQIPLTANGKTDRKALLTLNSKAMNLGNKAEKPRNSVEKLMVGLWQDLLKVPDVGINDNFFHLGGDSIRAIQLSSKMQKRGLQVDLNALFRHPTIKALSAEVTDSEDSDTQEPVRGEVPLTPIQAGFFEAAHPEPDHYNQSHMLFSQQRLVEEHLLAALDQLCSHHDALRMRYDWQAQPVKQWYAEEAERPYTFSSHDLSEVESPDVQIRQLVDKAQQNLDLENGPLMHCALFRTSKGDHLQVVIHHLVVDGVSWRILLEDFTTVYQQLASGKEYHWPAKTSSFQQWSQALWAYAEDTKLLDQYDYWRKTVAVQVAELPKDGMAQDSSLATTGEMSMYLSPKQTDQLISSANQRHDTQINDLLLTALSLAIHEWNGADAVRIHLEGHGREAIFEQLNLSRTVGWFTSLFPVLLPVNSPDSLSDSILSIKETLRAVPDKGVGYGVLKYLASQKDLSSPAQIVFNYLGQFDPMEDDLWDSSHLSSGRNKAESCHREQVLGINGAVSKGKLHLRFDYNQQEFTEESITGFVASYQQKLEEIIQHTTAPSSGAKSSSGFKKSVTFNPPQMGLVLNAEKPQKLFAFPSLYGMAVGYAAVAKALEEVCMVGFDFIDDKEWRMRYYQAIKAHQPYGPYVFFGYSGGAILAFEMAKFFEAKGENVSDLIFIDQEPMVARSMSEQHILALADGMLNPSDEVLRKDPFGQILLEDADLRNRVRNGIIAYKRLLNGLETQGTVNANIQLILEEGDDPKLLNSKLSWHRYTSGQLHHIQGSGRHRQLFASPHFELNIWHLRKVLESIYIPSMRAVIPPIHSAI